MSQIIQPQLPAGGEGRRKGLFRSFKDTASFSRAIKHATGMTFDLGPLLELPTDFIQATDKYLLLNIKEYGIQIAKDNLLFLTENETFVYSQNAPSPAVVSAFEEVLQKPFGNSTIITFLVINQILDNHKVELDNLIKQTRTLEKAFDHDVYRQLSLDFEQFSDRLEEFHDLIIGLQERRFKQVQTQYIVFDYRVLIAESQSLQARCRRRIGTLKDVRQDHEIKSTEELNSRIIKLNDVVKKLTAITVILMLPTLIASHFGMNFRYMPELTFRWTYPAVIGGQIILMGVGFFWFRKIGWL